jgi:tetratricopeptide (TPR) repeat protein
LNLNAPRGTASTDQRGGHVWNVTQSGIDLCRRGQWKAGLAQLAVVESLNAEDASVPGLALTYLGYGIASQKGRIAEGLRYCRAGVDRESWQAENHLNLARTYLLAGSVKRAIAALEYGLSLDPDHAAMLTLRMSLGMRRPPPFTFLERSHPLNRIVGKLRHHLTTSRLPRIRDVESLGRASRA